VPDVSARRTVAALARTSGRSLNRRQAESLAMCGGRPGDLHHRWWDHNI